MNLTNLQRDMAWPDIEQSVSWGSTFILPAVQINSDGVVHSEVATAISDNRVQATISNGSGQAFGVFMKGFENEDNIPFRVKVHHMSEEHSPYSVYCGFNASPTGSDDLLAPPRFIGGARYDPYDEIVCIKYPSSNMNTPIGFGVVAHSRSTDYFNAMISVQRLIVQPPTYASAVS